MQNNGVVLMSVISLENGEIIECLRLYEFLFQEVEVGFVTWVKDGSQLEIG